MRIILVACGSKKLEKKSKAKDLYISPLFKYSIVYARKLKPDKIFILSAKYGLLELAKEIEPYNKTLNKMSAAQVRNWSAGIVEQLRKVVNLNSDEIIFLAGDKYRKYLIPHIANYKIPLKGLGIGKQLKFLKEDS